MPISKSHQAPPIASAFIFQGLLLLAAAFTPLVAEAQAQTPAVPLPASQAAEFIGRWNVKFHSEIGPYEFVLSVEDSGGSLVGVTHQRLATDTISDVSRDGNELVLRHAFPEPQRGLFHPAVITLARVGEFLSVVFVQNFEAGRTFTSIGMGTRATD